jgi:transposase-like protein
LKRTITKAEIKKMKLKGKPKCPACNNPLSYVYEGSTGFSSVKCKRCSRESLINTETLEAILIEKAS